MQNVSLKKKSRRSVLEESRSDVKTSVKQPGLKCLAFFKWCGRPSLMLSLCCIRILSYLIDIRLL